LVPSIDDRVILRRLGVALDLDVFGLDADEAGG
jgi:hypothetical protein